MDLIIAKELVRQRFIVGLMDEMNESIRRFNIVLGVDESSERSQQCMEDFGLLAPKDVTPVAPDAEEGSDEESKTHATDKKNSNKHPKVSGVIVCVLLPIIFAMLWDTHHFVVCTIYVCSSRKAIQSSMQLLHVTPWIWSFTITFFSCLKTRS